MDEQKSVCPGCGLVLPRCELFADSRFNESPECRSRYDELSLYTWSLGDAAFLHQHIVDAHAASHAGEPSRPIQVFFALAGLYLALEKGYTGQQVQQAHVKMGGKGKSKKTKNWPTFTSPPMPRNNAVTVADVLAAPPGAARDTKIFAWCRFVWDTWQNEHERIRTLTNRYLE